MDRELPSPFQLPAPLDSSASPHKAKLSPWRRVLGALINFALLGVLLAAVAPSLHGVWPFLGLLQHFAAQLGAASALLTIGGTLLRRRASAGLGLLLTIWYAAVVYPFLPLPGTQEIEAGPPLKVLSLNLWYLNENHNRTIEALLASDADVIATIETSWEWRKDLKALAPTYPYHSDCTGKVSRFGTTFSCGVALYSKLPFIDSTAGRVDGSLPTMVAVKIDWEGRPLTIAALQLVNPTMTPDSTAQTEQAAVAANYLAQQPGDLLVMGDFNSTPWSKLQNSFRAYTGLDNRQRLTLTWPSWAPAIFRLPIDQIFVRGKIVARNVRAGADTGSDHLPIMGEIYRKKDHP